MLWGLARLPVFRVFGHLRFMYTVCLNFYPTGVVGLTLLWPPRRLHGQRSPVLTLGVCTCQAFVYFSFLEFPVSAF